jgi:hypothetical protein
MMSLFGVRCVIGRGAGSPAHTNLERFNPGLGDLSTPAQRSLTTVGVKNEIKRCFGKKTWL